MGSLIRTSTFSCNIQQFRARVQRLENSLGARSWTSSTGVRLVFGEYPYVRWVYESMQDNKHVPIGMLKWSEELERAESQNPTKRRPPTRASWIVLPWSSTSMRPWYDSRKGIYRAGIEAYEETNTRVRADFLDGYSPEDPKKDFLPVGQPFEEFVDMVLNKFAHQGAQTENDGEAENIIEHHTLTTDLIEVLRERFSEDELKTLCLYLRVDYENLPAMGKAGKARELVLYFERRKQLKRVIDTGIQLRPDINWPTGP